MAKRGVNRVGRYAWLANAVNAGGIVLTASRRLSRDLRAAFDDSQVASGARAWNTPEIVYWRDWCRSLLTDNAEQLSPSMIGHNASAVLWERCLRRNVDDGLLSMGSLVQQAQNAWQRLAEWQVPVATIVSSAGNRDERLFARSAEVYQERLNTEGWLDPAGVPGAVLKLIATGRCDLPARVLLAGFDQTTPIVRSLLESLQGQGCAVSVNPPPNIDCNPTVQSFPDVEAELRAAGAWARALLLEDSTRRIAIVSSDLNTDAARYARLIREGLVPGWQLGGSTYRHAVNVSFGRQLADYPAVATALLCLRWITGGLPSSDVGILLRSSFLDGGDAPSVAALDLELRQLPDRQWSPAALSDALSNAAVQFGGTERVAVFRRIASLALRAAEPEAPAYWAAQIGEVLDAAGWPGEGKLGSVEFQLVNRWRELLNELAALDNVLPTITLTQCISKLESLAREVVYQAETGPGMVSLIGGLEAAGMEFDDIWVMGVDADRWPAPGSPLALVSRRLQQKLGMPDANPTDTLEYSRRVLGRLTGSATQVILSWARADADSVRLPSPFIDELESPGCDEAMDPGWFASGLLGEADPATFEIDTVPAVEAAERLAGGVHVVALQWRDPFSAFAIGRLGISELDRFRPGLTPRLRGILLHDALELLLRECPTRDSIDAWTEQQRQSRIEQSVDRALARRLPGTDAVLRRLFAFERMRLHSMLTDFLLLETQRSPFRIERVEEKISFEHAGLSLRLRADRIDRLDDNSIVIIDYKSGSSKKRILDKNGDPVEPQLLVYAAATQERVGALVLVNISRRAVEYVGVGGEWGKIGPEEWPDRLEEWTSLVYASVDAIAAGDARLDVSPGSGPYPQLNVLSRREEHRRER